MQTLMAQSAFWRGVLRFAGMLLEKLGWHAACQLSLGHKENDLVSWCSPVHSRREDELERSRLARAL